MCPTCSASKQPFAKTILSPHRLCCSRHSRSPARNKIFDSAVRITLLPPRLPAESFPAARHARRSRCRASSPPALLQYSQRARLPERMPPKPAPACMPPEPCRPHRLRRLLDCFHELESASFDQTLQTAPCHRAHASPKARASSSGLESRGPIAPVLRHLGQFAHGEALPTPPHSVSPNRFRTSRTPLNDSGRPASSEPRSLVSF